jgi:ketosteroid isomerase-like protein
MKRLNTVFVLVCIFVVQAASQDQPQKIGAELRRLETSWLTANLNNDRSWLGQFSTRKLFVLPPPNEEIENRADAVKNLTATTLQPKEMKVRISGTISLLTNDSAQNRSYYFLDTFNKIRGKWQVIASSISPTPITETVGREETVRSVLKLENEWARAAATNDRVSLSRILSPDIVSTSADGAVRNFQQLIDPARNQNATRSAKSEMQIRTASESLAIVTGVETTVRLDRDGKEITHVERFTDTWSKSGHGQWQCVASHMTRLR